MTTAEFRRTNILYWFKASLCGAYAGLAGGYSLAIFIGLYDLQPMIGSLVKQNSPLIILIVQLLFSAIFGTLFGLTCVRYHLAVKLLHRWWLAIPYGLVFAMIMWAVNGILLMPGTLSIPLEWLIHKPPIWFFLAGHLIYGVIAVNAFAILYWRKIHVRLMPPIPFYDFASLLEEEKQLDKVTQQLFGLDKFDHPVK